MNKKKFMRRATILMRNATEFTWINNTLQYFGVITNTSTHSSSNSLADSADGSSTGGGGRGGDTSKNRQSGRSSKKSGLVRADSSKVLTSTKEVLNSLATSAKGMYML